MRNAKPLAIVLLLFCLSRPLAGQTGAFPPSPSTARAVIPTEGLSVSQRQFQGSVPAGKAPSTPLRLSLQDAINLGLKNNLGLLESDYTSRMVRAQRMKALSALLPNVAGNLSETAQQTNLAALGIRIPFGPTIVPTIIGPFGYTDARASASQTIFDWTAFKNLRSASESVRASEASYRNSRDLVVEAVAGAYLQVIATGARVEATRAQVMTAQALYKKAEDQHQAGVSPVIDVLRSQVELKSQQQILLSQENQLAKDKLNLARAIGLPPGQIFELSDTAPYSPLEGVALEGLLHHAYESRADYQSTKAQLRAAELSRQAARAQRYPSLSVAGNYGAIGTNLAESHGAFTVTGSLNFNIFDGGRIRADILRADTAIRQRKDELANLEGQIDQEVRTALLDLTSAAAQVEVARSNVELAGRTLTQARDRFTAGVTDNIEVIQAQESVASAHQNLISSLYAHNLAKVSLARAVGMAEVSLKQFMGGK